MDVADYKRDVVVIGAGVAGTAAAWRLARSGRSVTLVDARPVDTAGPRWVNGVPPWVFDFVGLAPSSGAERYGTDEDAFTVFRPSGIRAFSVSPAPVWNVDMRLLTARLHGLALAAGVEFLAPAKVRGVTCLGDRLTGVELTTEQGPLKIEAALFVDASGMGATLRRRHPVLSIDCPKVPRRHICSAAQYVFEIKCLDGAKRHLDAVNGRSGETLSRVGVSGGWSVGNLACDLEEKTVDLLTGAIAMPEYADGPAIMDRLLATSPWIGNRIFGGHGAIPLRRPYDRLAAPGLALLGDAACQVFSMHGSGIAMGLVGAKILSDVVESSDDPGDLRSLWHYQALFHRDWGGLLAAYDLLRRAVQALPVMDVETMLEMGVIDSNGFRAGLEQRLPSPSATSVLGLGRGLLKRPRLATRLRSLAKIPLVMNHYRRYPQAPDEARLARWSARAASYFNDLADVRQP